MGHGGNLKKALQTAFEDGADYAIEIHADNQYSPNEIVKAKQKLLDNYDLIIDALFGTGFRYKLKDDAIELCRQINKSKIHVLSIDMPSGISSDTGQKHKEAIEANTTLTFHRYKPGQWLLPGKKYCGKIELLDIELVNLDAESKIQLNFPEKLPIPNMQDHKFSRGSCLILAGKNLVGAAKLGFLSASQSSLRAGAGLCKLVISDSDIDFFSSKTLY